MSDDASPTIVSIPQGLGPGDVPSGPTWPRSVWIIIPELISEVQSDSFSRLRLSLEGKKPDLPVSEVRVKNVKGRDGFTYPLVPPKDVAALYRRAHRARTAVIALGGAKVLLDISERPTNRGCVSLEKFIRYKCCYKLISRPEEVDRTLGLVLEWMDDIYCEGPRDPRCFPMSVFETARDYALQTRQARRQFINDHRRSKKSSALTDVRGRSWQVGPDHTFDLLQVAGQTLPIGFHWDVQAPTNSSVIATGWERWRLPGRGYTNIHPDALVRGGNATKTHPTTADQETPRPPRTPRDLRRRKGRA